MKGPCNSSDLEALALGELAPEQAQAVLEHASGCQACRDELAWLRAERDLMARRARQKDDLPPELWRGVERRLAAGTERRPRSRAVWVAVTAGFALAAAALVLAMLPKPPGVATQARDAGAPTVAQRKVDTEAVLDAAEHEYQQAIAVLEGELRASHGRLPPAAARSWETTLARARANVTTARQAAGRDPDARLAVLDGYATWLRSLEDAVAQLEERKP
jgi:hypothetical protein